MTEFASKLTEGHHMGKGNRSKERAKKGRPSSGSSKMPPEETFPGENARSTDDMILDAALELFSRNGYKGTTTRSIAEGAGVNEVTLFRRFGSKEGVFLAVLERGVDIDPQIEQVRSSMRGDLREDLINTGLLVVEHMERKAPLIRLALVEARGRPEVWERVSRAPELVLDTIRAFLEEAISKGKMRRVDPEVAAMTYFSYFFRHMVLMAFVGEDRLMDMDRAAVENFVDIYLYGMKGT